MNTIAFQQFTIVVQQHMQKMQSKLLCMEHLVPLLGNLMSHIITGIYKA